jgi:hypothetical protein
MSRIRADKFVNSGANGAPQLTYGAEVVAGVGLTGAGGINITGIATAASFSGATGSFTGDVDIADKIVHTGDTNTAIRFPAADTFTVETGGGERVRVDSSGRALVGTISALSNVKIDSNLGSPLLQVSGGTYQTAAISVTRTSNSSPYIYLNSGSAGLNATGSLGRIMFNGFDGTNYVAAASIEANVSGTPGTNDMPGRLTFSTSADGSQVPTERLRITSDGEVQIANGNLKFTTAGKGIDFSATNDPGGMTSELLDDYEEGTWTPTIGGNATYTNQVGTYVKVGRMVYAHWALTINAQGTGSNISAIDGLPYPSGVASQATSNLLWSGFGVSMAYAAYYVGNGSTLMNLSYIATAAAALTNNPNGLVNGATMNGTIVYYSSY